MALVKQHKDMDGAKRKERASFGCAIGKAIKDAQ